MTGVQLAREFYGECKPFLYEQMPDLMAVACAGLSGEGSECFGCDDEFSLDHDFGAAFCLWLPQKIIAKHRKFVEEVFRNLPKSFKGYSVDVAPRMTPRRGPLGIEKYYFHFTGLCKPPQNWREWLAIPEIQLAAATNGEIFEDNAGIFSHWRKQLLQFYPEDVRLKKIAARCMQMAQSGQYNLPRSLQRADGPAAMLAASRFAESAISLVFLLNKQYMPFYKWAPKLGRELKILGAELGNLLTILAEYPFCGGNNLYLTDSIENFCVSCATHLYNANLSDTKESWLWAQGPKVVERIKNQELRAMDMLREI